MSPKHWMRYVLIALRIGRNTKIITWNMSRNGNIDGEVGVAWWNIDWFLWVTVLHRLSDCSVRVTSSSKLASSLANRAALLARPHWIGGRSRERRITVEDDYGHYWAFNFLGICVSRALVESSLTTVAPESIIIYNWILLCIGTIHTVKTQKYLEFW